VLGLRLFADVLVSAFSLFLFEVCCFNHCDLFGLGFVVTGFVSIVFSHFKYEEYNYFN